MSLRLEIDKELEKRFRETAMKEFGYSKGSLRKAGEEAFSKWLRERDNKPVKSVKDPVNLIKGGLSGYKGRITSVQMQHEATKIWIKKAD